MKTLAVYHSKGGVGKTSTCVNLAWTAAQGGDRILVWDLDPQGGATYALGGDQPASLKGKKLVSGKSGWDEGVIQTPWPSLDLLPSGPAFRHVELLMEGQDRADRLLEDWLKPFRKKYDWVFLDCPPGMSLLSENIFRAADLILIPVIPSPLAVRSLGQVEDFINLKESREGKVRPFLSMADFRKKLHKELGTYLLNRKDALQTVVPPLAEVEKMVLDRRPSAVLEKSRSQEIYRLMWAEVCSGGVR